MPLFRPPPAGLQRELEKLGQGFDGKVGIAVREIGGEWTAGSRAAGLFPQQSVSKLWVAVTLLDAVDRGALRLDEPVTVTREDLTLFHQPITALVGDAGYTTSLAELLRLALTESDNTANDVLLRRVGGPRAIAAMLARKQLDEIAFGPGERILQTRIAGLDWNPAFTQGRAFWRAREGIPDEQRQAALASYLAAPPDSATPDGIVRALTRLQRGELLSSASTGLLLDTLAASRTGARRLRAGLPQDWALAHKTGTGQVLGPVATGFNDVGLLTAPSGRIYAVAVMIARTTAPIKQRQALSAQVARIVVTFDSHRAT